MMNLSQQNKLQRHEQISKAATRAFISQGYHRTTVREIAKEAGLSLGSLYSYIRTKDDILCLVFEDLTSALRENIRQAVEGIDGPVEQIKAALSSEGNRTASGRDSPSFSGKQIPRRPPLTVP